MARRCFLRRRASHSGRLERYGGRSAGVEPCAYNVQPRDQVMTRRRTHAEEVYTLELLSWNDSDKLHLTEEGDLAGHEAGREGQSHGTGGRGV